MSFRSSRRPSFLLPVARAALAALVLAPGCQVTSNPMPMRDAGVGVDGGGTIVGSCDTMTDSDGDGLFDAFEGNGTIDTDRDGTPDHLDLDSDGDAIPDAEESGAFGGCAARNSDDDEYADFRDNDSDNDGLSDRQEREETGTDPTQADTDGDGFDDLAEFLFAPESDPLDPSRGIPADDFYVVLPYEGGRVTRNLRFGTALRQADVFFMMDRTGSMDAEESALRSGLADVVDRITTAIPDIGVGFGGFSGFGAPYAGTTCVTLPGFPPICTPADGPMGDTPFNLYSVITTDRARMLADVALLRADAGGATWASHNEAMFQAATGDGIAPWVAPQVCPEVPDERGTRFGYPCFRPGSLPILVVLTDTSSKNGPLTAGVSGGTYDAAAFTAAGGTPPHTWDQTRNELLSIGARVVGVLSTSGCDPQVSNPTPQRQFEVIARETGTVRADGTPLVITTNCNATGLTDALVDAIQYLATETPNDISTATEDGADYPPEVGPIDAPSTFINRITPRSLFDASPPSTIPCPDATRCDATQFYAVTPGDNVEFEIEFENRTVMPRASAQVFRATIVVLGNGVARLDEREVVIVVPAGSVPFVF